MPTLRLSDQYIRGLKAGEKDMIHWDTLEKGFAVKVTPAGRKVFLAFFRVKGVQRKPSIGEYPAYELSKARGIAHEWIMAAKRGEDPSLAKQEERRAPTMAEFCDRYIAEYCEVRKKSRSIAEDKRYIAGWIKPKLGKRKLADTGRREIQALHSSLSDTPYQANRLRALLSRMFSWAEELGLRPDHSNPVLHVQRYAEMSRERYLDPDEVQALGKVLDEAEAVWRQRRDDDLKDDAVIVSPSAIRAVRLLLATGCRVQEILRLPWSAVDLESRTIVLADAKAGGRTVFLNELALGILRAAEKERGDSPWVCPGWRNGECLKDIQRPWQAIRMAAGIGKTRLHDLRHTHASFAVSKANLSLPQTGALLGHKTAQVTMKYAHLQPDMMRTASDKVGQALEQALRQGGAEIVDVAAERKSEGKTAKKGA
ncbi:MAG: tyrosine-type recombinase/integrase [Candidatus Sumerlaeota bacterium]|nr:tyrosine-type recombinase/integrase [Candidatus Sumerlaeota bacterium]